MKTITSKERFHWVHDGKEEYDLGSEPCELSDEAYGHLISVFGTAMFSDAEDGSPKDSDDKPKKKKNGTG